MNIIPAARDDIAELHSLIERAYRGDTAKLGWTHEADLLGGQRTDQAALQAIFDDPDQVILAARKNRRLVGCVQLSRIDNATAYLGMLTVDPAYQASGLGKTILQAGEYYARATWATTVMEMTVIRQRTELIAYYRRRGYELTGETRPFPVNDPRFGLPKIRELEFVVLQKTL